MSNLLKRGTTVSKSERIIDYNSIIKDKLSSIMVEQGEHKVDPDGFVNGLNADVVEALIDDSEEGEQSTEDQDNGDQTAVTMEEINQQAEQILDDANQQAEQIIADAHTKADQIMQQAEQEGLQKGSEKAQQELDQQRSNLDQEYEQRQQELESEYQKRKSQIEPELVDVLTEVFEKVTNTVAEDNKDIILHLINSCLKKCELSKNFVIKVSTDDYKFVAENQGKIFCAMNAEVQLDVMEDTTMKKNECLIETDTGIFNCSLDIELKNLIRDIKLLSCL